MIEGVQKAEDLHHAYVFEGVHAAVLDELLHFLEKTLKISTRGNPDMHVQTFSTLTIDEGRRLKTLASERVIGASPKLFVVAFESATREAQNALLKLFEEPTPRTHFFVIVPRVEALLPTLRSRLEYVRGEKQSVEVSEEAANFLSLSPAQRLEAVKEMVDAKDKHRAGQFLNAVEHALYEKTEPEHMGSGERDALAELGALHSYMGDRSPSVKQILEHVALTLPVK